MKYRKYFVTNSSSSCFIASYQGEETCIEEIKKKCKGKKSYVAGKKGDNDFNGSLQVHDDFDSRLNLVLLEILHIYNDFDNPHAEAVFRVFEEEIGVPLDISYIQKKYQNSKNNSFSIDHESVCLDNIIFGYPNSVYDRYGREAIRRFLFGKKSCFITAWDGEYDGLEKAFVENPDFKIGETDGEYWNWEEAEESDEERF